ncbi:MBL fold metallo-hydrolase [Paracoccus sp. Z118]|uniref:MBL fold metallo-hydrolase n=1 Tax=Paracoccus sp. Z118 TaxID=2851017 RepID=UPI001C2C01E1|nr:MBL fold metallo-hydrolase [Paracoccus sp. Z118]MBV0892357.1 MBL fold metallo-hydrolase [Paracoccus sp. Z118]
MARNPFYQGPLSDHFDGVRFHSPWEPPTHNLLEIAWMNAVKATKFWPVQIAEQRRDVPPERTRHLRISLIGHASFLLQLDGINLLIDPVYADTMGPVPYAGPKRAQPPGVAFEDLPRIDAILITHNHYDHMDLPAIERLFRRFHPRIIAPLGNDAVIHRRDPHIPVETYDWGEHALLTERLVVHLVPSFHWSGRGVADRRMTLWASLVLTGERGVLYHVGDTGYGDGSIFRQVRERFGPPDVALLPIGAYEPRWFMQHQHVDPDEAIRIMLDTGAARAFGHHWGTFQMTYEPQEAPPQELARALAARGLPSERFQPLSPGQPVELDWR